MISLSYHLFNPMNSMISSQRVLYDLSTSLKAKHDIIENLDDHLFFTCGPKETRVTEFCCKHERLEISLSQ